MKGQIILTGLALSMLLSTGASALEVPTDTVVQNLNGSQQVIKTYTILPEADPQELIEEPFILDGYRYTFADIVKKENRVEESKLHTEIVTVETQDDDLDVILEQLAPAIEYTDGEYGGTLALDHTSIRTQATGYSTHSYTVSETKTFGPLDRNDMSYVPATTIKDGVTLTLSDVDWQVTGTDLVGEALMPSSYQAVASYSGRAYYQAADGYITTAEYVGEITRSGVETVTYQLTYLGEPDYAVDETETLGSALAALSVSWPYLLGGTGLLIIAVLAVLLIRSRREAACLRAAQEELPMEEELGETDKEEHD
ncbi:hypothetical protein [Intestinimonas butyriciproducens]|jgi:hypothetical protein|uniref:hypothetical protein n=1 Tax=Intestinimonas butyriciproducens TaxID=1297617 RepID=UPI00242F9595